MRRLLQSFHICCVCSCVRNADNFTCSTPSIWQLQKDNGVTYGQQIDRRGWAATHSFSPEHMGDDVLAGEVRFSHTVQLKTFPPNIYCLPCIYGWGRGLGTAWTLRIGAQIFLKKIRFKNIWQVDNHYSRNISMTNSGAKLFWRIGDIWMRIDTSCLF